MPWRLEAKADSLIRGAVDLGPFRTCCMCLLLLPSVISHRHIDTGGTSAGYCRYPMERLLSMASPFEFVAIDVRMRIREETSEAVGNTDVEARGGQHGSQLTTCLRRGQPRMNGGDESERQRKERRHFGPCGGRHCRHKGVEADMRAVRMTEVTHVHEQTRTWQAVREMQEGTQQSLRLARAILGR